MQFSFSLTAWIKTTRWPAAKTLTTGPPPADPLSFRRASFFSFLGCSFLVLLLQVNFAGAVNLRINAIQPGATNPVAVRAIIKQSSGAYLEGEWLNPSYPVMTVRGKAITPNMIVQVVPGLTEITIGKGPDYLPQTLITNLTADTTLNVILQPALNFYERGWRAAEMHVHYIHGEQEIIRTPDAAWAICAAGGYNLVGFCEELYGAGTLTRQQMLDTWKPYEKSECQLWVGVEEPKNAWGHHASILYDPWTIRSSLPYHYGIHSIHAQGGVSFPVHPGRGYPGRYYDDSNGVRSWFLYPYNNFSKSYPLDAWIGHLLDGWSGVSDEPNTSVTLPPYFKLLSMGYRIPMLADSDFCMDRINNGDKASGFWMTYYQLEGHPVSRASIAEAMRKGRVMSTTGPMVLFTIDNAGSGETLPADGTARTLRIEASYTFNPWTLSRSNFAGTDQTKITQINLFRNGQLFRTWNPNTPTAVVQQVIQEAQPNSYYMVQVIGNEGIWMVGYASPIYFDSVPRSRQPPVYKSLVQGRIYDAQSGATLEGTVSCVRYGQTEWTIPTDPQGRFQANVPLDGELVARDQQGRSFTQSILNQESVYSFCHYLPDRYGTNEEASIDAFTNVVRKLNWEFPIGLEPADSFVWTDLTGDAVMSNFSVVSAPPFTPGKGNSEIVMLLMDKTQAMPGDTVNYAVIYRSPGGSPSEMLSVEWKAWNPTYPNLYTKHSQWFHFNDGAPYLISLGNGFYMRQSAAVVPSWAANATETTAGLEMIVTVRPPGRISETAMLLLPVGPTQRQLLVSSTWDGFPASWGEVGVGPCNFRREWTDFQVRYSDYRKTTVNFTLNGQPISVSPSTDTVHVADADDAIFRDHFYYDGQCEPQFRNVPFRDFIRPQPSPVDYSGVAVQDPADTTPPMVVAIEPVQGESVNSGPVFFYYLIDDAGTSPAGSAALILDGVEIASASASPIRVNIAPGPHSWQIRGSDQAANTSLSLLKQFTAVDSSIPADTTAPIVTLSDPTNNAAVTGTSVSVAASASDNVAVTRLQFQLDNLNLGAPDSTSPYGVLWDSTASTNGSHLLRAIAFDGAGNSSTSAVVTVTANNVQNTNLTYWVDEKLPQGAIAGTDGGDGWTWVATNPAPFSKSLAHQSNEGSALHQHYFYGATETLLVKSNDTLIAYVYLDPVKIPSEVMLQWNDGSWEHRAYWGANNIAYGTTGTGSRLFMGPVPAAGQWIKLSVLASQVGLEGRTLKGMSFSLYGGRATWDAAGLGNGSPAPPPAPPDTNAPTVTVTSPANSSVVSGNSVTVSANAADNVAVSSVQFLLDGANLGPALTSAPYALVWNTTTTSNGVHTLAAQANDAAGNQATSAPVSVTVSQSTNALTFIWLEDATPAGAILGSDGGDSWTWISSNPTPFSGSKDHPSQEATKLHQHYFYNATVTMAVKTNDTLFAYVYLDPAKVPSEVMLQWNDGGWEHRAYWGANQISYGVSGSNSRRYMGPLPAVGQWVKLAVPAKQVGLEGRTLSGMSFTLYGGVGTWDYAGKSE